MNIYDMFDLFIACSAISFIEKQGNFCIMGRGDISIMVVLCCIPFQNSSGNFFLDPTTSTHKIYISVIHYMGEREDGGGVGLHEFNILISFIDAEMAGKG